MPSPVGHLLAGVTVAWVAEATPPFRPQSTGDSGWRGAVTALVCVCAVLALAPDIDVLFATHRAYTHSVGAAGLVAVLAAMAARWHGGPVLATATVCALAWGSHVFLDWLGHDGTPPIGLMAMWPFSDAYYVSSLDLFADVSRRYWKLDEFIVGNAWTILRELAILVPAAALAWMLRGRILRRAPVQGPSAGLPAPARDHESRASSPESRT